MIKKVVPDEDMMRISRRVMAKMKHFAVFAITMLIVLTMVCRAEEADFSGKWSAYRLFHSPYDKHDDTLEEYNNNDYDMTFLDLGSLEFKDSKVYLKLGDDYSEELHYMVSGDKLVVDIPDKVKELGLGLTMSIDIYFEGDDLVLRIDCEDDGYSQVMKMCFRRIRMADAADLSGKWVNYRSSSETGWRRWKETHEATINSDNDLCYLEFRDGKVFMAVSGNQELEFTYKASGDKFVVDIPDKMKSDVNGFDSIEFSDKKLYIEFGAGEPREMLYDASSDTYVLGLTDNAKAGISMSMEFYFEGSDLIFVERIKTGVESRFMKHFFRRPK